jgi:hypothetical protein
MLSIIPDLPAHVTGIRATGKVTKYDFEQVLIPAINDLVKRTGKINYLLLLETPISNFTLGAWIDDAIVGLKHFTQWHKIAIVTDQKGVEKFSDIFGYIVPGESKGFKLSELGAAKKWVSEN